MALISDADTRALTTYFRDRLDRPVTVDLFVDSPGFESCESCADAQAMLEEVAALSDKIELRVHDIDSDPALAEESRVDRVPTIVLRGAARGLVRFIGAPAGYEFGSLVRDMEAVSRGSTGLKPATRESLASVARPVSIQVFVTPTCPYCPGVASLAHQMAVENEWISTDVVLVNEFPDLGERYHVHGVPKIVINDEIELLGAQPEAAFVSAVLQAARPERAVNPA